MSLKFASHEISQCDLLENVRTDTSDNSFTPPSRDCESETARKIDQSINYMRQNLDKSLQASVLAALVNISPSHYFALFKHHTGCAPIDYFTRLRMQRARRLLDSTSSSVKEIADTLGYNDPFYFSRVFKSVNQVAPSKYRMQQKNLQVGTGQDDTHKFVFQTTKTPKFSGHTDLATQTRMMGFNSASAEKYAE